jgi:ABC-type polar amino acid transport system ATPase subunit
MVFQSFNLYPHMTIYKRTLAPTRNGIGSRRSRKKAKELLDRVGSISRRLPGELLAGNNSGWPCPSWR